LRARVAAWRQAGKTVALVPTMGALHEGHLTLVRRARDVCDRACVSLFVNPTQFGPTEDFAAYPRDEGGDRGLLGRAGCDLLYAPTVNEMYPAGFATRVTVEGGVAAGLCALTRPHHFGGVAVVVAKLLLQALPDVALFGEKDYQQLQVIRRLVRDLDIPVRVEGVPVVREQDGLALSSRNAYLTAEERARAPLLFATLIESAAAIAGGSRPVPAVLAAAGERLAADGFGRLDYLALCDAETLAAVEHLERPGRLLAAVWLGRARLLDNVAVLPAAAPIL